MSENEVASIREALVRFSLSNGDKQEPIPEVEPLDEFETSSDDDSIATEEDDDDRYEDDAEEPMKDYDKGGYYPVYPGDVFAGRFFTIRKLGWGHFATVWLTFDTKKKSFAALKVSKSREDFVEAARDELMLLNAARNGDPLHIGYRNIVKVLHDFELTGINDGFHHCIVFEVLGANLLTILRKFSTLNLNFVKVIAKQLLQGLAYLHDECNIIHTDIKPENVVISMTEAQLHRMVCEAYKTNVKTRNMVANALKSYRMKHILLVPIRARRIIRKNRQKHRTKFEQFLKTIDGTGAKKHGSPETRPSSSQDDYKDTEEFYQKLQDEDPIALKYCRFKIVDFGNACFVDKPYTDEIQTQEYRSPESIFRSGYDTSADIWSAACLIFELISGEYLFCPEGSREKGYSVDDDHIAKMIETLGRIPPYLFRDGRRFKDIMTDQGDVRRIRDLSNHLLLDLLVNYSPLDIEEAHSFARFLKPMLQYDPNARATASECLISSWLTINPASSSSKSSKLFESSF